VKIHSGYATFSNCRQLLITDAFASAYCKVIVGRDSKIVKTRARDLIPDAYNALENF